MSSAKKRSAVLRAKAEADILRQRLALAEGSNNMLRMLAEVAAQRHDEMQDALKELVALKTMKDEMSHMLLREEGGMGLDYDRRKPLAWQRARELVGSNAGVKAAAEGSPATERSEP